MALPTDTKESETELERWPSGPPDLPPPASDRDDEAEPDEDGGRMSFLEHLDELRRRLVISLVALLGGFLIAILFIGRVFEFMMRPLQEVLPEGGRLIFTEPMEAFLLQIKMAALVGVFLAAPIVLWQVWLFVAPGLYAHEKRFAIPFVALASVFFLTGGLFSHYVVFPWAWQFFVGFSTDYLTFMPRIQPVFSLYARMLLAFGVIFQMPTVVFFLARMGLITPRFLIRHIKYAILIIFVIAAVLTPTGDPVTQALMAGPMIALYGLSIGIAWVCKKRPPKA